MDDWLKTKELAKESGVSRSTIMAWYEELNEIGLADRVSQNLYLWHPSVVGFMISRRGRRGRAIPSKEAVVQRWFSVQGETATECDDEAVSGVRGDDDG